MRPCKHILLQGRGDHARGKGGGGRGRISEFTSQDLTLDAHTTLLGVGLEGG